MTRSSGFFLGTVTLALLLALVLSVVVGEDLATAAPQADHRFQGMVYNDSFGGTGAGQPIQARIDNANYASSLSVTTVQSGGAYGPLDVCGNTTDCWQSAQVGQIRTREDYYYEELRGSSLRVLL